jgi:anti-sigma B factor antagonist
MGLSIVDSPSGACLAAIDGEMNIYAAAGLKEAIGRLAADCKILEIDLSGATEIDTAGLQLMLMAGRLPGCSVRFINPSPAVRQLLEQVRPERSPCPEEAI